MEQVLRTRKGRLENWKYSVYLLFAAAVALPAQTLTTLHSFNNVDGAQAAAPLVQSRGGDFFGTTEVGGAAGAGTVFKISPAGKLTTLYSFCSEAGCADGQNPYAGLVAGADGDLYGTTHGGGMRGAGTVFKISPAGVLMTIYNFCSHDACYDGATPYSSLVLATDGDFYGTTESGGFLGFGVIFKITSGGALTDLYSFCSQKDCTDGKYPFAGLIQGADGDFYGTTKGGGYGEGTIFRMTPSGALTTLYSFCAKGGDTCPDGENPYAPLVQASGGDLYGTTQYGGTLCLDHGCGTIFKVTATGAFTTLYSFCPQTTCTDGKYPSGALLQAKDGNLYGTTSRGGDTPFGGTVFRITPSGVLTTLYSFCSQKECADGVSPSFGVIEGTDGNYYGTTVEGGQYNYGTVFELAIGGSASSLE